MRLLYYAFDEALSSVWRRRTSALLAMGTIAIALFVLGASLVVTGNLARLAAQWARAAEMSVYLADQVTPVERHDIELALARDHVTAAQEFVSKAEALRRFKQTFGDLAAAVDDVGGNPLPASFEVRLRAGAAGGPDVDALGAQLRRMPGVVDVRYDRQWLTRLLSGVRIIRGAGFVLSFILTVASGLTIGSVVRLALDARRDELEIMQLVGAPRAYVRGPFVMEGVLQGGMGAAIAVLALGVAFAVLQAGYVAPLAVTVDVSSVQFLPIVQCLALVSGGMAVGCLGGLAASLRV
jgi:cell division transport system permease protein